MKKYLILFVLFANLCFSQKSTEDSPLVEIFVLAESSNGYGSDVQFTLSSIGTAWKAISSTYPKAFEISNQVNGGTVTAELDAIYWDYTGFNYSYSGDHSYPEFGFGFYKLSYLDRYIYLDYRDYDYGAYNGSTGHNADIWIKYDFGSDGLYLSSYSPTSSTNWGDSLRTGEYYRIWEIKSQGMPNTNNIPNFWSNGLVLIKKRQNPRLVWGPHPSFSETHFKIYRAVSSTPLNKPVLYASLIATVSSQTFDYRDIDISLNGSDYIYYFVKAYNSGSSTYLSRTNIISTRGGFYKKAPNTSGDFPAQSFNLFPNYPNPFNPSTTIDYQLPKKGLVVLKIYDVLGKEVAELVNETKDKGIYEVTFNANNLPSGMYYYKIQSGEFTDVKKMMLLK